MVAIVILFLVLLLFSSELTDCFCCFLPARFSINLAIIILIIGRQHISNKFSLSRVCVCVGSGNLASTRDGFACCFRVSFFAVVSSNLSLGC